SHNEFRRHDRSHVSRPREALEARYCKRRENPYNPAMLTLSVQERKNNDSNETLREKGLVPAVFYGPTQDSSSIAIHGMKLARLWKEAGETTLVKLTGAG